MPVIANAAKALRKDRRRTVVNRKIKTKMRKAVKEVTTSKDSTHLSAAFSAVDRAAKKNLIHKKKAARVKSQLAKLIAAEAPKAKAKPAKKASKAKAAK